MTTTTSARHPVVGWVILALAGSLISGILAFGRHLFSGLANVLFLLATIAIAAVELNLLLIILGGSGYITGILGFVVSPLYALLLLIAAS